MFTYPFFSLHRPTRNLLPAPTIVDDRPHRSLFFIFSRVPTSTATGKPTGLAYRRSPSTAPNSCELQILNQRAGTHIT